MEVHFTARKFRPRKEVRTDAIASVRKLDKYYGGIMRADIILSFEHSSPTVKAVEINMHVYGMLLSAKEQSEEFGKSIDLAVAKIERQLAKYKTKLHMKNKKALRRVKEDVVAVSVEEEE